MEIIVDFYNFRIGNLFQLRVYSNVLMSNDDRVNMDIHHRHRWRYFRDSSYLEKDF